MSAAFYRHWEERRKYEVSIGGALGVPDTAVAARGKVSFGLEASKLFIPKSTHTEAVSVFINVEVAVVVHVVVAIVVSVSEVVESATAASNKSIVKTTMAAFIIKVIMATFPIKAMAAFPIKAVKTAETTESPREFLV